MERAQFDLVIRDLPELGTNKSLIKHGACKSSFYKHVRECPDAAHRYACAQEERADELVDEIIDISDTELDAQRARNRIDARKWCASKLRPIKYGERLDLNLNTTVDIRAALSEAQARVLHPRFTLPTQSKQVIDITQQSALPTPDRQSGAQDAYALALDDILS